MENVKIAKVCGLCAGCKYAISTALKSLETEKNVCFLKELVHNEVILKELKQRGIDTKNSLEELEDDDFVIIRAHGEPESTFKFLDSRGIKYADCSCTNVKNIHKKVQNYSDLGYKIILIGKYGKFSGKMHPEIVGTIGWCNEPILIEDEDDISKLSGFKNEKFYLVCQTTFNFELAELLAKKIQKVCSENGSELTINLSICSAQRSIIASSAELARDCDVMFVVGSKTSSNTTELYNNLCKVTPSVFLEDINLWKEKLDEIKITLAEDTRVGITAGASASPEELSKLKAKIEKYISEEL